MKKNKDTVIFGQKVVLVPYKKEHVLKYHDWMQREELQQLTASEPLSLDQEYAMQQSWLEDDNKCTFIVLDAAQYTQSGKTIADEIESMVGDVNLFLNDLEDKTTAEIEIMIAETAGRGRGLGKEALLAMMRYGMAHLGLKRITAKIGFTNTKSLALFHKLNFQEISRSEVFQEVTLALPLDESACTWLDAQTHHLSVHTEYR